MRRFMSVLICCFSIICLSACGTNNEFSGYWLNSFGEAMSFPAMGNKVYIGSYDETLSEMSECSYIIDEDTITIFEGENETTYNYEIMNDVLTLSNEEETKSFYGNVYMQEEIAVSLHTMNGGF